MAELTFKSPGVSTREIDLSGPTKRTPTGIPAGIIGTADQGRAFVPITVATFADFVAEFGNTDGEKFGPMAMRQWMRYARAGTYFRVLGIGDGKKRNSNGSVTRGGFIVGSQEWKATGEVGPNAYAGTADASTPGGLGRTYMLGCIMAEKDNSNVFLDAGIGSSFVDSDGATRRAQPILRGVLMAPSGVALGLSASRAAIQNNTPLGSPSTNNYAASFVFGNTVGTNDAGSTVGAVNMAGGRQEFVLLQNGHTHTDQYPTVLTASFDPNAPNYFSNVFNTDPTKVQEAGHFLYAHWDVYPAVAFPTGSGLCTSTYAGVTAAGTVKTEDIGFLLTGSAGRISGDADVPNFESFSDRFRTAVSPYIVSQKYGGSVYNLFRIHALDDGAIGNTRIKISIENIAKSTNVNQPYGAFDLLVRDFNDTDSEPIVIEKFSKLSLDPGSDRYIARLIGDYHLFYDFDKRVGSQKLVLEGAYPNKSNYVRVETNTMLDKSQLPSDVLPVGFRGIQHLVTSGSSIFDVEDVAVNGVMAGEVASQLNQYPVPFRKSVSKNAVPFKSVAAELYWGVQFTRQDQIAEPNKNIQHDPSIKHYATYFPNYAQTSRKVMVGNNEGTADSNGTVLDCDTFNNDLFSLENIQVVVGSDDVVDSRQWAAAQYQRRGVTSASIPDIDGTTQTAGSTPGSRLLSVTNDFGLSSTRRFLKFTTIVQGGFDGANLLNRDKATFSNTAVMKEMDQVALQGGVSGPTVSAYRKAMDVLKERSDVDIQLLAIPGIRHKAVTDYVMEAVEERFDAVYVMDIEGKDTFNQVISGSSQLASVTNTVNSFAGRNLDNSFAAAYFPDLIMTDIGTSTNVQVPPSVAVLGAFALNDSVAYPWFAPAGFTRGALKNVLETQVKLSRANLDALYDVDINPITAFPQTRGEVVVFGQKTLLAAQSALDRVNVRRLLIDVRRQVRSVGDTFLFEPNRESTLARFAAAVNPILARIQQQQGLDRFKVQIDTTTTTQADVENNIVRGKIFLQPTRSVEFISLDFVVTNAGTEI